VPSWPKWRRPRASTLASFSEKAANQRRKRRPLPPNTATPPTLHRHGQAGGESYREGGKVRTRTVEYLGAVDPATAAKVKDTRRKLGKMDMDALAASVKGAVAAEIVPEPPRTPEKASGSNHIPQTAQRAQKPPQKAMIEASDDAPGPSERERQTRSMIAGGEHVTVDTRTGEILTSHGPAPGQVITTETPVRPYRESLELPGDLDQHGLSNTALQRTHRRYGQRLQTLGINPGNMATVSIAYGHPDKFTRKRDGSHIVQVSRRTGNKRHTINKTALWKHYRQAMSMAYLDTIEPGSLTATPRHVKSSRPEYRP